MRIGLITTFAPFEGLRGKIQELCALSWAMQSDIQVVVVDGGEVGVKEICQKYSFKRVEGVKTARDIGMDSDGFLFDSFLLKAYEVFGNEIKVFGYTCGDIIVASFNIAQYLMLCYSASKGNCSMHVRRRNLPCTMPLSIETIGFSILQIGLTNYPGIDTLFWSRIAFEKLLKKMPPFNMRCWGADRWLLHYDFDNEAKCFDMTTHILTGHIEHPRRAEVNNFGEDGLGTFDDSLTAYNMQFCPREEKKSLFDDLIMKSCNLYNGICLLELFKETEE